MRVVESVEFVERTCARCRDRKRIPQLRHISRGYLALKLAWRYDGTRLLDQEAYENNACDVAITDGQHQQSSGKSAYQVNKCVPFVWSKQQKEIGEA